ncbi:type IV secretion system protein VirB10 [Rheinheimera pacifica]|uniref:TrbI/VirB10 family protein n=1 Tax=Rheinheimera pacifica TaxID=173990 RepID=UPI002168CD2E|nr:TrbI/VirB10 family protein [Rheinheimera pacifica]MCS4309503.1 type IV secretion system protein VirB10 [Rheinheimera pacifica]
MSDVGEFALTASRPKPARINRSILWGAIGIFGGLALFALLTGLQAPEDKSVTPGAAVSGEAAEPKPVAVTIPQSLINRPSTYSQVKAKEDADLENERIAMSGGVASSGGKIQPLQPMARPERSQVEMQAEAEYARMMERVRDSGVFFASDAPNGGREMAEIGRQVGGAASAVMPSSIDAAAQVKDMIGAMGAASGLMGGEIDSTLKQNLQDKKIEFAELGKNDNFINATFTHSPTPYMLLAGDVLPAVSQRGVNTDLPGDVTALVTSDVYDSRTGRYLLVPQGSRLFGRYQSIISYGQTRVLVAWKRLCRPDGCLDLGNQLAVDTEGYSGLSDQVDNHYGKIFVGVIASSVLSAGAATSQGAIQNGQPTFSQMAVAGVGEQISEVGGQIIEKTINIQPTLTIRPGQRFNIQIDKDFIIPPYNRR